MRRSSQPRWMRDQNAARNLLAFAQRPRVAEFDGVAVPMFTLPCGVLGRADRSMAAHLGRDSADGLKCTGFIGERLV